MASDNNKLRNLIRETLEESNIEALTEGRGPSKGNVGDWPLYEEFGTQILQKVGYSGSYYEVLSAVKKRMESEGWRFGLSMY